MMNKIDFTFGIITDGISDNNLLLVIQSIMKQSIENFEIIIVDDLSTDRTKSIVQE